MRSNTRAFRGAFGVRLVPIYAAYAAIFFVFVGPVLWMLTSSIKSNVDIVTGSGLLFTPTLEHYAGLFRRFPFMRYVGNSTVIAGTSTLIGLAAGASAAFVIARRRTRGLAFVLLLARMAPGMLFVLPLYVLSVRLDAANRLWVNYALLIAAHLILTLPLATWLTLPFFEAVPKEIDEAARVDGCTVYDAFWRIHLPLASQGLAIASILCFIFSWNYFLFALILSNSRTMPLPVIAFNFVGQGQADWGGLMAASTVLMAPAFLVAVTAQRRLVAGLTSGAVK
jgi:multiple sugar transport system permease protein